MDEKYIKILVGLLFYCIVNLGSLHQIGYECVHGSAESFYLRYLRQFINEEMSKTNKTLFGTNNKSIHFFQILFEPNNITYELFNTARLVRDWWSNTTNGTIVDSFQSYIQDSNFSCRLAFRIFGKPEKNQARDINLCDPHQIIWDIMFNYKIRCKRIY